MDIPDNVAVENPHGVPTGIVGRYRGYEIFHKTTARTRREKGFGGQVYEIATSIRFHKGLVLSGPHQCLGGQTFHDMAAAREHIDSLHVCTLPFFAGMHAGTDLGLEIEEFIRSNPPVPGS